MSLFGEFGELLTDSSMQTVPGNRRLYSVPGRVYSFVGYWLEDSVAMQSKRDS